MTKLATILDQIDAGSIQLPEFQRGYVWNRDQVRHLMHSLYRGYPVGSFLVWETAEAGVRQLLLDGQQRITTLYGIMRGRPPRFFHGNPAAFTDLRFNVEDESFEFYAPVKMKDDPRWIDVTRLFTKPIESQLGALFNNPSLQPNAPSYTMRLTRLRGLLEREFHIEKITGVDRTIDEVVEIFNRVNSGGTKLSQGDLALAKVCARWRDARDAIRTHLNSWRDAGYDFRPEWLLRNVTGVATGRVQFSALDEVSGSDFQKALDSATRHIGHFLDVVAGQLGLDHDRVLMGRYAFPVVTRLLHLNEGHFADTVQQNRVLYWYVQSALRGRFAGSTETVLAQDYETLERRGVDGLIAVLERSRGVISSSTPRISRRSVADRGSTRCSTSSPGCAERATSTPGSCCTVTCSAI